MIARLRRIPLLAMLPLAMTLIASAQATPVPYTLTFVPSATSSLPALHSYCLANVSATQWLVLGGRYQNGLHTFNSSGNFAGPNTFLWSIDPVAGKALQVADLSQLQPSFGNPLTSTNQECEYNAVTGYWYAIGGYGVTRPGTNFQTFPTITRIPVPTLLTIVNNGNLTPAQRQAAVAALLNDPATHFPSTPLQVTGGVLSHMASGLEFLAFGQVFTGSYNPFASNTGFTQTYTQQVVPFTISNCTVAQGDACALTVNTFTPITSTDPDNPFNRRDFAAGYDVDPTSGGERFAVFGGVFRPGAIAAYDYPVYITGSGTTIQVTPDHTVHQHLGFYNEPLIVAWDGANSYHTFFGGISHYFLNQTPRQKQVYALVTTEGRNDGMPFAQDIGTLIESPTGAYQEFVAPKGVPKGNLDGSSVDFVPNLGVSQHLQGSSGSVVNLASFRPGERALIGYIYGGIEAQFPLPCVPSHGTQAVGTLYSVYLTKTPWPGLLPASKMTEATGYFDHESDGKPLKKAVAGGTNPCSTGRPRHATNAVAGNDAGTR